MRVFIGMETSGALRRRFLHLGHDVFSCDMLPAEDGGDVDHIIGDVFEALGDLWAIYGRLAGGRNWPFSTRHART